MTIKIPISEQLFRRFMEAVNHVKWGGYEWIYGKVEIGKSFPYWFFSGVREDEKKHLVNSEIYPPHFYVYSAAFQSRAISSSLSKYFGNLHWTNNKYKMLSSNLLILISLPSHGTPGKREEIKIRKIYSKNRIELHKYTI